MRQHERLPHSIPYPSLILLGFGYACFGWLMGLHRGGELMWAIAWLSSMSGAIDDSLILTAPVIAAIATILTIGLSSWALVFAVSIGLGLFLALFLLGWSLRAALRDSLWLGGIVIIFLTLAMWLGVRQTQGYGALIAFGQYLFALALILGLAGSGLGGIAWLQMRDHRLSQRRIRWVCGLTTALGLIAGGLVGFGMTP
jgi:hypothetical protein